MLNGKLKLQAVQKEREEKLAETMKNRLHTYERKRVSIDKLQKTPVEQN